MKNGIRESELMIFEDCSHAPIYEDVTEFNGKTLAFLQRQLG
jgi:pimeloyl-ACP methyl ester carboxylesterase